ncbi:MAG: hypothetical protein GY863_00960 [bacterium]|nr:hypothetical protein [bacterium]
MKFCHSTWMVILNILLLNTLLTCSNKVQNDDRSIDDLITGFQAAGLQVTGGEYDNLYKKAGGNSAKHIGALDGRMIEIEGKTLEIYKFDLTNPEYRSLLSNVNSNGVFRHNEITVPARVNGSFLLICAKHPKKKRIERTFVSFQ